MVLTVLFNACVFLFVRLRGAEDGLSVCLPLALVAGARFIPSRAEGATCVAAVGKDSTSGYNGIVTNVWPMFAAATAENGELDKEGEVVG